MTEHAVLVAGAGPTGLMLAGELALAGVDVAIVERRPNQELIGTRAGGLGGAPSRSGTSPGSGVAQIPDCTTPWRPGLEPHNGMRTDRAT